jgi:hypothetical protein
VVLGVGAGFGVLFAVINMFTGAAIATATGIPGAGGFVMFFLLPALVLLFKHILARPFGATLVCFVLGLVALATPILGPPGFLPKLLITVAFGLTLDLGYEATAVLKERIVLRSIVAGVLFGYVGYGVLYAVFRLFLPEAAFAAFENLLVWFMALNFFEGAAGGAAAAWIYRKIEDRPVIRGFRVPT